MRNKIFSPLIYHKFISRIRKLLVMSYRNNIKCLPLKLLQKKKNAELLGLEHYSFFFYFIYSKSSLYIYLFLQEERTYCLASSSASSSSSKCATCPLRKWTRYYGWVSCIKITLATVKKSELKGYYLFYEILLSFSFLSLLLFLKAQLQSRQLSLSHILSASTGTSKN